MQTTMQSRPLAVRGPAGLAGDTQTAVPVLIVAAALAVAVAVIHLQDQGGLLGGESPTWLKYGYYLIEISSIAVAGLLIRGKTIGWLLAVVTSAGPFTGYLLSRTVGVPGDPGDVGNWGYTLGTVSLLVEGALFTLAVISLWQWLRAEPATARR